MDIIIMDIVGFLFLKSLECLYVKISEMYFKKVVCEWIIYII